MNEEKLKILEMIKDGTISPEDGMDLLQALEPSSVTRFKPTTAPSIPSTPTNAGDKSGRKPRFLHIKVDDDESGKKVNIKIPLSLAKFASNFIPKEAKQEMKAAGVDLDITSILEQLESGGHQNMIEVNDGGKKVVHIYCE